MRKVREVAEESAELARRKASVGNWSRLQQAREQGLYADAALNVARAAQANIRSSESLTRLLGMWEAQMAFTLPELLQHGEHTAQLHRAKGTSTGHHRQGVV